MGGKRPDQYQIAPGETTRTDYKWTADADPIDLKNQPAARSRARARDRQLIPPAVPEPGAERQASDRRARRTRRGKKQRSTRGHERGEPRGQ